MSHANLHALSTAINEQKKNYESLLFIILMMMSIKKAKSMMLSNLRQKISIEKVWSILFRAHLAIIVTKFGKFLNLSEIFNHAAEI